MSVPNRSDFQTKCTISTKAPEIALWSTSQPDFRISFSVHVFEYNYENNVKNGYNKNRITMCQASSTSSSEVQFISH